MAYFSNGSQGADYEEAVCKRCVHHKPEDGGCVVWLAHLLHNSKEANNADSILHLLIPMDEKGGIGKCAMFQKRTFNLNDRVLVKLTDWGKEQLLKKGWSIPVENEAGQSDWQFHQLMLALGEDCYCSFPTPFHPEVEFIKP